MRHLNGRRGQGRAARWTALVLAVAAMGTGCSRSSQKSPADAVTPDGYKSPYLAASPATAAVAASPAATPEPAVAAKPTYHPASGERPYPLKALAEIGRSAAELTVLETMTDPKRGSETLDAAKKAGKAGVDLMRRALGSSNRTVRMQAALVLGNLKDKSKETVTALTEALLLDPDPDCRATAAKTFVVIEVRDAVPALLRSLNEDPFEPARANAAWALGNIGSTAALPALRKALKDEDTWVRLRSVSALKKMKARVALADLEDHYRNDPNPMVRERAGQAIQAITGKAPK